jgi:WD40 repeat protein
MKQLKFSSALFVLLLILAKYPISSVKAQEKCRAINAPIFDIQFSADGNYLIANWPPNSVRVWDAESGLIITTLTHELMSHFEVLAFSPDNKFVATGGNNGAVRLWDIVTGRNVKTLVSQKYSKGRVKAISFSPNADLLLVTYGEGHSLWNLASGAEETQLSIASEFGQSSAFSPDGKYILTQSEARDAISRIRIWDTKSRRLLHTFENVNRNYGGIFSPDAKSIVISTLENSAIWDLNTYRHVFDLEPVTSNWQFSSDGRFLIASKGQETIVLWSVEKGQRLHVFSAETGIPLGIFFPQKESILLAKRLIQDTNPQTIFSVREIASGKELHEVAINIDMYKMHKTILSPNGKHLIIGTTSGEVASWDIETGKQALQYC